MAKKVTIRDIAKKAGVSANAVSMALRNHPRISEATRKKIQEIADKEGYVVNPMVSALMKTLRHGRKPNEIRVAIVALCDESNLGHYIYLQRFEEAAAKRAFELGLGVEHFYLNQYENDVDRLVSVIRNRGIYAALLIKPNRAILQAKDLDKLCVVAISLDDVRPKYQWVDNDQYQIISETINKITGLGYKHIGCVIDRRIDSMFEHIQKAAVLTKKHELSDQANVILIEGDSRNPDLVDGFVHEYIPQLIKEKKLDALIGNLSKPQKYFRSIGYSIPEDIGYAAFDVFPHESHQVSGMIQDYETVSERAIDILEGKLTRNERGPENTPLHIFVEAQWNPGKTAIKQS